jgi:hypothetical protein
VELVEEQQDRLAEREAPPEEVLVVMVHRQVQCLMAVLVPLQVLQEHRRPMVVEGVVVDGRNLLVDLVGQAVVVMEV